MQTINGKLIAEPPELDELKRNTEILAQQFERLEVQMTVISKKDQIEQLQKITSVQQSLQKLELLLQQPARRCYFYHYRLNKLVYLAGFLIMTQTQVKLSNQQEPIVSVKPAASR